MRQHLKNFWWLAGIPVLIIALCFAPVRELLGISALRYNFANGFWAYGILHVIALFSFFVWFPFKLHRRHFVRATFILIYGFLLIVLSLGRADFLPRTENLTLFRMYVSPHMSYEQHITNLVLRRGDWVTFEEECVRPLHFNQARQIVGASRISKYCKTLGSIELGYGIHTRNMLEDQYAIMRAIANDIAMGSFDYQKCMAETRCVAAGDRMAIAITERPINTSDLWCYKADSCVILPILIRNANEAELLPIPAEGEVTYNVQDVYNDFETQPFFTPRTCQFNPLCSLLQLVGAPIK